MPNLIIRHFCIWVYVDSCRIERQKIDFDSYVALYMCRIPASRGLTLTTHVIHNYVNEFLKITAPLIGYIVGFRSCADITHSVLYFEIYGVTLFCPIVTMITISLPQQNTNRTKIKTRIFRFCEFYFFQSISLFWK